MNRRKIWRVKKTDPILKYIFQHELKISPVLATLLANRGISTVIEARLFLEGSLDNMHDPYLMADMEEAVGRIGHSLDQGEKILIYGDYDADGTTATALLVRVLRSLGGMVDYYVPHRMEEGYGLHLEILRKAGLDGFKLVVTVDCGISSVEEVAANRAQMGPDVIITDHHEPPDKIPEAVAVLNPKRGDCRYPFKELAGVGVALKLAQALLDRRGRAGEWVNHLDLACLGTVADIVPLIGENRVIVKYGLNTISSAQNTGIKSLIEVSGIKSDSLGTREVGFALAPRLNAAGRIGDASISVDLLLTGDPEEAAGLAEILDRGNQERQRIEGMVLAEAMGILDADPQISAGRVIVLASEGWHSGVVGIVASRLVERYYKPVLMISLDGDEGKGSGRSIPGLHLYNALHHCAEFLIKFGGHAQAAGFTINTGKVVELRRALNEYADKVNDEIFIPGIELDAMVSLDEITDGLVREIQIMAPFGHSNPGPLLACRGAGLVSCREIGRNGGHLKLRLKEKNKYIEGIAFKMASCADEISAASEVDVAFSPSINEWKGKKSIQLEVKDIRPSGKEWLNYYTDDSVDGAEYCEILGGAVLSLETIAPVAHIPEFITRMLTMYVKNCPNFLFPGDYLKYFYKKYSERESQPVFSPRIINDIDFVYKPATLLSVLGTEQNSLVLVNSPAQAVELASFLLRSGITAGYLHSGVTKNNGEEKSARAVVCTYECIDAVNIKPGRAVLYDVPYSLEGLGRLSGGGVVVHSLVGERDINTGREYLDSLAPGRDLLAEFYAYLVRMGKTGYIIPGIAAEFLRNRGLAKAGPYTIAFSLSVFADLGLVNHRIEGEGYRVGLNPFKTRQDIRLSDTFRAGQEIKTNIENWWESLRKPSGIS
ncbi:MAG: single-stranded-DNA-specific exonuclease RecJ [Bacillota bacterium]